MQTSRLSLTAAIAAVFAASDLTSAGTWFGGNGAWDTAANWSDGNVPDDANEFAVIDAGTILVDTAYNLDGVTLTGGAIGGSAGLTTNRFTWTGGVLSAPVAGGGDFRATGTATLGGVGSGSLTVLGPRTLSLGATSTTLHSGATVSLQDGGRLENRGAYSLADGSSVLDHGHADPAARPTALLNYGTLAKTGGTGTSTLARFVNVSGTVAASSGTVVAEVLPYDAANGLGQSGGQYRVDAGATLSLSVAGEHRLGTSYFDGSGTVRFTGGTFDCVGYRAGVFADDVRLEGATLIGFWGFRNLTWTDGTLGKVPEAAVRPNYGVSGTATLGGASTGTLTIDSIDLNFSGLTNHNGGTLALKTVPASTTSALTSSATTRRSLTSSPPARRLQILSTTTIRWSKSAAARAAWPPSEIATLIPA